MAGPSKRLEVLCNQLGGQLALEPTSSGVVAPSVDVDALQLLLDHDNYEMRAKMKEFMKQDVYVPQYDIDLRADRELALERLKRVCRAGLFSITDFRTNPLRIFAAHEVAAFCDPSMATKMTGALRGACRRPACLPCFLSRRSSAALRH